MRLLFLILFFCVSAHGQIALTGNATLKGNVGAANKVVASGGGSPAFASEIQREANIADTTTIFYMSNTVASGHRAVLLAGNANIPVSSVTDARGNTWTVHATVGNDVNVIHSVSIASANMTTALQTGDAVTITWPSATYGTCGLAVWDLTGCATSGQPDVFSTNSVTYTTSVSLSATTATANTIGIGMISGGNNAYTYSGGGWTTVGAALDFATSRRVYLIYKVLSSTGSQNPSGTWSAASDQANAIVFLK
jgi:hypothetical protein